MRKLMRARVDARFTEAGRSCGTENFLFELLAGGVSRVLDGTPQRENENPFGAMLETSRCLA